MLKIQAVKKADRNNISNALLITHFKKLQERSGHFSYRFLYVLNYVVVYFPAIDTPLFFNVFIVIMCNPPIEKTVTLYREK